MEAGLILAVKPNSTTCRAADVFGKMHGDLWPSARSLPPAAAQRLLFTWGVYPNPMGAPQEEGGERVCVVAGRAVPACGSCSPPPDVSLLMRAWGCPWERG